jgi:hypothetical protein
LFFILVIIYYLLHSFIEKFGVRDCH